MNTRIVFALRVTLLCVLCFETAFAAAPPPLPPSPVTDLQSLVNVLNNIANVLFTLLMIAAVIFILFAAFTFMTAGGDTNKVSTARSMVVWSAAAVALGALSKSIPIVMQQIINAGGGDVGGCFLAGTKVRIAGGGTKEIQMLEPGDRIISYDIVRGREGEERVRQLLVHQENAGGSLLLNGTLKVTPNHAMWDVHKSRWRHAGDLSHSDVLMGEGGEAVPIHSREATAGTYTVYNIELEGPNNNYFAEGLLVHNAFKF